MSFLLHFMEARLWSALWQEQSMPEMFAGVLDPEHQGRILERLALFWVAVTDVEAMGEGDAWELRQEIYWLPLPAIMQEENKGQRFQESHPTLGSPVDMRSCSPGLPARVWQAAPGGRNV